MSFSALQQSIRHLVDEWSAADAMVAYYAFHHDADKTYLVTSPPAAERAEGFVTISRTGIDLFRPLLTMRLPIHDLAQSRELLMQALPPGQEAFAAVPESHLPLVRALCEIQSEEPLNLYALPAERFKPLINVLVTREDEHEMPRFVVKQVVNGQRTAVAAAGLNWLSPRFGEIAVRTRPEYRQKGFGRGVVGRWRSICWRTAVCRSMRLIRAMRLRFIWRRVWGLWIRPCGSGCWRCGCGDR